MAGWALPLTLGQHDIHCQCLICFGARVLVRYQSVVGWLSYVLMCPLIGEAARSAKSRHFNKPYHLIGFFLGLFPIAERWVLTPNTARKGKISLTQPPGEGSRLVQACQSAQQWDNHERHVVEN